MKFFERRRFFRDGARPSHDETIRDVDAYRDQFGVERICRVVGVTAGPMTSRGYRAATSRPMSDRAVRDQVARVMKTGGVIGVKSGKTTFTTGRKQPTTIQLTKLIGGPLRSVQASCGWRTLRMWQHGKGSRMLRLLPTSSPAKSSTPDSSSRKTDMSPLQAFNMAAWNVSDDLTGLVRHSHRGNTYVSWTDTNRILELGAKSSVGSKGDSYGNAMAESQFTLFKTELIRSAPGAVLSKTCL